MNDTVTFVIESGVALPPRTIPNAGPRESKYPVDSLQEGQAFAVPVTDEKQARQKQSQFSGLAKTRGIKLVTRYFSGEEGSESPFANTPAPCLGVWHGGKATPKKKKADASEAAPNAGSEAPDAAMQPASDDTVVL